MSKMKLSYCKKLRFLYYRVKIQSVGQQMAVMLDLTAIISNILMKIEMAFSTQIYLNCLFYYVPTYTLLFNSGL